MFIEKGPVPRALNSPGVTLFAHNTFSGKNEHVTPEGVFRGAIWRLAINMTLLTELEKLFLWYYHLAGREFKNPIL